MVIPRPFSQDKEREQHIKMDGAPAGELWKRANKRRDVTWKVGPGMDFEMKQTERRNYLDGVEV